MRTPEANDREAVGRSMGLTENQVNEIAKLPSGVAVVYQNDWVSPVLTMIDKANVEEFEYINKDVISKIIPLKEARSEIIAMLMQPWIKHEQYRRKKLYADLRVLELSRNQRKLLASYIEDYVFLRGTLFWRNQDISVLQMCIRAVLYLNDNQFEKILTEGTADVLRKYVESKTQDFSINEINEICNVLTKVVKDENNEHR